MNWNYPSVFSRNKSLFLIGPSVSYLVTLPPIGDVRPQFLVTHHLSHLFYGRVRRYQVIVRQLVLLVDAWSHRKCRGQISAAVSLVNTDKEKQTQVDYSDWKKKKGQTSTITATCNLPVDQPQSIDVSTFERVKVSHVDSLIQNLWSHVPVQTTILCKAQNEEGIVGKVTKTSETTDGRQLQVCILTRTFWCQPSDWVRCR